MTPQRKHRTNKKMSHVFNTTLSNIFIIIIIIIIIKSGNLMIVMVALDMPEHLY
jgi:hypothetical protein